MKPPKQLNLQTKLFFAYLLLTAAILLFFAMFFYSYVSRYLVAQEQQSLEETNRSIRNQVEELIHGMDTVSINLNYSSIVQEELGSAASLNLSQDNFEFLADLFVAINGTDTRVDFIYLYDFDGNMLQIDTVTKLSRVDTDSLSWLDEAKAQDGGKVISLPYYRKHSGYSDWSISLYRTFTNQYGRAVGAVETTKRCKSLFNSVITYTKKTETPASIYIYNENGELMYPYELTESERASAPDYYALIDGREATATCENPLTGVSELVTSSVSAYTGWTYAVVQDRAAVLAPVRNMLRVLLLFTAAMLAVSILISYRLSRGLVKPIKHLKHVIQRMQIDTLGEEKVRNYPTSVNELTELYDAFSDMNENLRTSMNELIETREQELKSRSLALQSQINPHFYCNCLANVSVLAECGQTDEIVRMCKNLTSIMRYVTDTCSAEISLRDEIDYVSRYLYCMKVRYQSSLTYCVELPEELSEVRVPRLLLQPLVENALKYGTDCEPPWHISVKGIAGEDFWRIDVADTGNGFSDGAVETIRRRLDDAQNRIGLPEMHIDGLGLVNVFLRWKLFCGDDIIFTYGNTRDGHGRISIGRYSKKGENQ